MAFQRARSAEQVQTRRDDILNACAELYSEMDFDEITLKMISDRTQVSRTTMYGYYKTKEEIFLDLLDREYSCWDADLASNFGKRETLSLDELADLIVDAFEARPILMRLMPIQQTIVERNSSMEKLIEFKQHSAKIFETIGEGVVKAAPDATQDDTDAFLIRLLAFCAGAYPFMSPTHVQLESMERSGTHMPKFDTDNLLRGGARALAQALVP